MLVRVLVPAAVLADYVIEMTQPPLLNSTIPNAKKRCTLHEFPSFCSLRRWSGWVREREREREGGRCI
jgi:hypothetical protein